MSIKRQIDKLEDGFVNGIEYDGYRHPSISAQLEDRQNAALGIISIVSDYDELAAEVAALKDAREQLLDTGDEAIYDKYKANCALQKAYESLISAMDKITLDNRSKTAMDSYIDTMDGAQRLISDSGYNMAVSEFEREILGSFPINILKYPAFAGSPEYFGAEG